jgi:hypothetical protein
MWYFDNYYDYNVEISIHNTEKCAIMKYIEVKYLYIDYMTGRSEDFKIIHKTENCSKLKFVVVRFRSISRRFLLFAFAVKLFYTL